MGYVRTAFTDEGSQWRVQTADSRVDATVRYCPFISMMRDLHIQIFLRFMSKKVQSSSEKPSFFGKLGFFVRLPNIRQRGLVIIIFFRHFISNLIGIRKQRQYLIAFTGLLILIVGSQNVYPQQQIALDTYAIFQQSCLICHGPNGAYKETLLIEHKALIEKGRRCAGKP